MISAHPHDPTFEALVLTPPSMGAMATLRLSGPGALAAALSVFRPRGNGPRVHRPDADQLVFGELRVDGETIDEGLLAVRGDDPCFVVEITTHGSVRIVERLMQEFERLGAASADESGNGDPFMHPFDRDVEVALRRCTTNRAVRFVTAQRRLLPAALAAMTRVLESDRCRGMQLAQELIRASQPARFLIRGLTVAFVGPTNAGKSTLVNHMFQGSRSLVSSQAGTTRDWVDTHTAINGVPVRAIDTAGLRQDANELEGEAIARGLSLAQQADVCVVVIDGTERASNESLGQWRTLLSADGPGKTMSPRPCILALNKCDLEAFRAVNLPPGMFPCVVHTSGLGGQGTDELGRSVLEILSIVESMEGTPLFFAEEQMDWMQDQLRDDNQPCPIEIRHRFALS